MNRIRVLIAGMPRMLSDIVGSLVAKQDDMELVGEQVNGEQALEAVERLHPDVVVLSSQGPELSKLGQRLFRGFPLLKLVTVSEDGRSAYRYEMRPKRTPIAEVSPQELLAALRAAVAKG